MASHAEFAAGFRRIFVYCFCLPEILAGDNVGFSRSMGLLKGLELQHHFAGRTWLKGLIGLRHRKLILLPNQLLLAVLKLHSQKLQFSQNFGLAFLKLLDYGLLLPQLPVVLRYQVVSVLVLDYFFLVPLELPPGLLQLLLEPLPLLQDF